MIYHMEVSILSRGKGRSLGASLSYISGEKIHDSYSGKNHHHRRTDLVQCKVYYPPDAPKELADIQYLCDELNKVEKRKDARTGRLFICSLPNELMPGEWARIVNEFIQENFVSQGLCAVAAIHRGKLPSNHPKSNPHVHIIVSTRTVGPEGFNPKKDREHNQRSYIEIWRRAWARVQNRAYERCHVKKRVSHESLRVQGVERKPTRHVSYVDLQRGERQRRIQAKELARELARLERNRELSREKTKTHSR
ncbi:MAG: MobA/MobL family protein [Acutalibacter sp.]